MLNSTYAFSICSKDVKSKDQIRDAKLIQILLGMYLEEVKEAYNWWKPHQKRVL